MKRQIKRVHRMLSESERARMRQARAEVAQEKEEILASGRRYKRSRSSDAKAE